MGGVAQPRCRLDQRIEDCLELERRTADHFEHLSRRGLLPSSGLELGLKQGFRSSQFRLLATRLCELGLELSFEDSEFGLLCARFLKLTDKLGQSCFESDVGSFHGETPSRGLGITKAQAESASAQKTWRVGACWSAGS